MHLNIASDPTELSFESFSQSQLASLPDVDSDVFPTFVFGVAEL